MGPSLRKEGTTKMRPKYESNKKYIYFCFNFKDWEDWNCKYTCNK